MEIKECPFCGGKGETEGGGDFDMYYVRCIDCGAEGAYVRTNKEDAIALWNKRVSV